MDKSAQILVPIDFSECSKNALAFGIQLADKIDADLLLLHVIILDTSSMENYAFVVDDIDKRTDLANKHMNNMVKEVSGMVGTSLTQLPTIQSLIETGNAEATICQVASRHHVDYIAMGTQGENSTLDKYIGSVASNVVRKAPCPVLVIPESAALGSMLIMAYATDFLDADPFGIWKAAKLFEPFYPTVKCVHFKEDKEDVSRKFEELKTYFRQTSPEIPLEVYSLEAKDKVDDMNKFIEEQQVDILVMYKPKRTLLESLFHRSYTQKMARHTHIPLLVFKETK